MFNLTNKTMYVGDKRVYGAWLGDKLIHGHEALKYPKPPTEYDESYLSWARFFGAGEEEKYFSSTANNAVDTFRLPSDYTLHPYGLKVNDNTSRVRFSSMTWTTDRSVEVTFRVDQDRADTISPGSYSTLINFTSSPYGGGLVRIFKDNDGNLSIGTAETPTREQTTRPLELGKTYTVFLMFHTYLQHGSYIPKLNIYLNGGLLVRFEGDSRSSEPNASDVGVEGLVTIYDMKYYYSSRNAVRTNYDGIKNIRFLGPEDMDNLITPDEPPVYMATDDDFGVYAGTPVYRGSELRVEIPHTIHGEKVTSLSGMFDGGTRRGTNGIQKVVNTNENITNVIAMFSGQETDHLDLSELYTPNANSLGSFFLDGKVKTLDMSGLKMRKLTNMYRSFKNTGLEKLDFRGLSTSEVSNSTENMLGTNIQLGYVDTQQDADFLNRPYYIEGDPFIVKE